MKRVAGWNPFIKYTVYFIVGILFLPLAPIFILGYLLIGLGSTFFE